MDIDLETIAQPISPDQPAGPALRGDGEAGDAIGELSTELGNAKTKEREAERAGPDTKGDVEKDCARMWLELREKATELLTTRTKDLEAATTLLQAVLRSFGGDTLENSLAVTRDLGIAFKVINLLVDKFWTELHPTIGPEGAKDRFKLIGDLTISERSVLEPLWRTAVASSAAHGTFTKGEYVLAAASAGRGRPEGMARLQQAAADTPEKYYIAQHAQLAECEKEVQELVRRLSEKCANDQERKLVPSLSKLKDELRAISAALEHLTTGRISLAALTASPGEGASPAPGDGPSPGPTVPGAGTGVAGRLESRSDALRMLEQVAAFFRKQDPLSLLALQLDRLRDLADMKPEDYFSEIVEDESARSKMFKLVGIKPKKDKDR